MSSEEKPLNNSQTTSTESNSTTNTPKEKSPESKKGFFRDTFESLVVTVIMALFGMTFVVQAVKVPTGSMLNTILIGDHLLVNKFVFGQDGLMLDKFTPHRPIKRGDIIVFKYPNDPTTSYVKRVIGLPGETIEIKGTKVFIDGKELPEQFVYAKQPLGDEFAPLQIFKTQDKPTEAFYKAYHTIENPTESSDITSAGQQFGNSAPYKIPANGYFAMGDNRDSSLDSRYWGTVPQSHIVGRAFIIYYSLDASKDQLGNTSSGNLLTDIFTRTRWSRIGSLVK
ncbi:MAG: signal peptidase I [Acidobacteria bacterium]|nr:signal peptidase I [Acidobacteriota bacterium]